MAKYLTWITISLLMAFSVSATDLETRHTPNSQYYIDYSDLDAILKGSVLDMGPSTHKPPKVKFAKVTGSRLQVGNTSITHQEGNRVMIHAFRDGELAYLRKMRDELLAIPSVLPLASLSRNQQLAYWFNLYTAIVLDEISHQYPITYLGPLFDRGDAEAFVNRQQFMVNGATISLTDIEHHVMSNWNDPIVIYGFYMGAVGTPNVRTSAYSGDTVYGQLRENAVDFVNSMRGTQIWNPAKLRVSKYYQRMAQMFPNFEASLLAHIQKYAKPSFRQRLITIQRLSPEIEDWHIADLYNGNLSKPGGRYPKITQGGDGVSFRLGLPAHVIQLLRERERKLGRQKPSVEIEELPKADNPD